MKRRLFAVIAVLSLVLCIGVATAAAASIGYLCRMTFAHWAVTPGRAEGKAVMVRAYNGKLGVFVDQATVSPEAAKLLIRIAPGGVQWERDRVFSDGGTSEAFANDYGFHRQIVSPPAGTVVSYDCVFPAWLAIPIFAFFQQSR